MGTITDEERKQVINNSPIADIYETKQEVRSAKDINKEELDAITKEQEEKEQAKIDEKNAKEEEKKKKEEEKAKEKAKKEKEKEKKNYIGYQLGKKVKNKA